jgi:hypothetical protein
MVQNIQDVHCTRVQFAPGDRVLVKLYQPLTQGQRERVKESIEKWAGVPIEVFIYYAFEADVTVQDIDGKPKIAV